MPSLELHPKLPQELRDKILTYVVEDEVIGLEVVRDKVVITDIKYNYSRNLKKLMKDKDIRAQLQPLIYEHALLDLERTVVWRIGRFGCDDQNSPIFKLRHFRRLKSWLHMPQKHIGKLFDNITYLRLVSSSTKNVIEEGHWAVLMARMEKTRFPLSQHAVVEVVVEPYYQSSNWKAIPPFRVLPDAARDEEARKWYAKELKDAMTSLAG
jgi:hypothetical protein